MQGGVVDAKCRESDAIGDYALAALSPYKRADTIRLPA